MEKKIDDSLIDQRLSEHKGKFLAALERKNNLENQLATLNGQVATLNAQIEVEKNTVAENNGIFLALMYVKNNLAPIEEPVKAVPEPS